MSTTSQLRSRPLLNEILSTRVVTDAGGGQHKLSSETAERFLDALHRSVLATKPKLVIEIGMAYGIASLAIACGLQDAGEEGQLISIDPNQSTDWHGVGVENIRRLGFESRHQLIEQPSYLALPRLLAERTTVDLAYIDGWHTFDYTLVDFFYIDRMLPVGGIVAFNDAGWRAVHKVIKFVATHRKYAEVDVGLKPEYGTPIPSFRKILSGRPGQDRYFRKLENWEPRWNFHARF